MKRVVIVGGGISGLAAAHRLREIVEKRDLRVDATVFEAAPRSGGVIRTVRERGFLIEEGPDSLLTEKPSALSLIERLGLSESLIGTQERHRRSFVARQGRLHPTPDGLQLFAPGQMIPFLRSRLLSPAGKLRMALETLIPARKSRGDESVGAFVRRRFGREALDRLAQPMVAAIYGVDAMALSLDATFPRFHDLERRHGGVLRGLRSARREGTRSRGTSGARYSLFVTLAGGLQELVDRLLASLPQGTIQAGTNVDTITPPTSAGPDSRWRVRAGGETLEADAVVVALPAHEAARLVRGFDGDLAEMLGSIRYGSAATVSLAWRDRDVTHPLHGFGFVAASSEAGSLLGCTFCHRKYVGRAPEGHALLRAFHGGAADGLSDMELIEATRRPLEQLLGVRGEPLLVHFARFPHALPQYAVGHLDLAVRIATAAGAHAGLALAGNAYGGVGVPDCVRSGEAAVEGVLAGLFPENR